MIGHPKGKNVSQKIQENNETKARSKITISLPLPHV